MKAGDKTVISAAFKKYVCFFFSYLDAIALLCFLIFLTNYERYFSFKHV